MRDSEKIMKKTSLKPLVILEQGRVPAAPRVAQISCCAPGARASGSAAVCAGVFGADSVPEILGKAVTGEIETSYGRVPVVSADISRRDRWNELRCRLGNFRMNYAIPPGIYAVGSPRPDSDVLVSANYKLSFDRLRGALAGRDLWILVIDTAGINVWCAAGKGTFGTDELARRIGIHGLGGMVTHRRIIVPQLGAPGVSAAEVKKRTGFRVHFGPVRASDIPAYLDAGLKATPGMREVGFGLVDRLVLTPLEFVPAMKMFPLAALIILAVSGLEMNGILFGAAWRNGAPVVLLLFAAVVAGAFLVPLVLPFIPFRSFALKGFLAGAAVNALLLHGVDILPGRDAYLTAFSYLLFPVISSYLALQFTGATAYTGISGVKKELKYALPVYAVFCVLSAAALVAWKLAGWGLI